MRFKYPDVLWELSTATIMRVKYRDELWVLRTATNYESEVPPQIFKVP